MTQESFLPDEEPRDWRTVEAGEAHFSPDRVYRYALKRVWDARRPVGLIIGLNPSTGDETKLDTTLRRCIRFSDREGWGGFWMANLFAYRATKPAAMKRYPTPIGEKIPPRLLPHGSVASSPPAGVTVDNENDRWLLNLAGHCRGRIICAWGVHGTHMNRGTIVTELLDGHRAFCLGFTGNGMPRHPLMLHKDTPLMEYRTGGSREQAA